MIKSSIILLLSLSSPLLAAPLGVSNLRADHEVNPIGVNSQPRLSWWLTAENDERGKRQTGFHILAASSAEKLAKNEGDLWDLKDQKNSRSHLIEWKGQPLKNGTTVHWKVKVWDEKEEPGEWSPKATFKVGGKRQLRPITSTSTFESSDPTLNKIFQTHKKALGDRLNQYIAGKKDALGYGAHVQHATREYLYNFSSAAALWHWIDLMNEEQDQTNYFPSHPGSQFTGLGNSDAGILVAHGLWWMSGDSQKIATYWKNMDNYMVARENADQSFRGRIWGIASADAPLAGPGTPREFIDLCYLGLNTRVMKDLALPGNEPLTAIRYKDFTSRIQKSFIRQYLKEDGHLTLDSQTAHLLALRANVIPPAQRPPLISFLKNSLTQNGLQAGPIGSQSLFPVLSFTGNLDLAFDLLTKENHSHWSEQNSRLIGTGATEWMLSTLAGIDGSVAGWQQVRISPRIPSGNRLTSVKASHHCAAGIVISEWKKSKTSFILECTIPPGTLAMITIPFSEGQTITESGQDLQQAYGTQLIKSKSPSESAQILAQSGTYRYEVK